MEIEDAIEIDESPRKFSRCARCRSNIEYGEDLYTVEFGVMGPRGVVPLEAPLVFCSRECVVRHFQDEEDASPLRQQPRRVP